MTQTRKLKPGMTLERSGRIRIRYHDTTGRRRSGGTYSTIALAERALRNIEYSIEAGTWIDPEQASALNGGTTLREVAEQFRESRRNRQGRPLAPSTLHEYQRYIEVLVQHLADKPISSITSHDIEKWWNVASRQTPKQTSHAYSHIKSVFTYAMKKKLIRQNPCDIEGASNYIPETEPEIPTNDQVAIFLQNSSPEYSLIIALASMGGLRKGEILDLRKSDIQRVEEDGQVFYRVSISKSVKWLNEIATSAPPKTRSSVRVIGLPQAINPIMSKHLSNVPIHPQALLFPRSPETPELHFSKHQLQRTWEKIRVIAGYSGRFHSLRGYALTKYAQLGATAQEIMDRGGHADYKVALRYQRSTGRDQELLSNW
jgi:integrase